MVAVEIGVQWGNFLRTQGSLGQSYYLKVSGARVHNSTGTGSHLSYFLIGLDLTLNVKHFVTWLQVKSGNYILVVVLEKQINLHLLWKGIPEWLWGSYHVSGESPLQPSLFSEKMRRNLEAFLLICVFYGSSISQELLKASVLEVFTHFQAVILGLSSPLFPLKFERLFIIKRFGSFMIH